MPAVRDLVAIVMVQLALPNSAPDSLVSCPFTQVEALTNDGLLGGKRGACAPSLTAGEFETEAIRIASQHAVP